MKQTAAWRFVCVRITPTGVIDHFCVPLSLFQSDFKRKIFVTAISSIFSTNEETDRLGNLFSAGYLQVRGLDPNAYSLRLHSCLNKNVVVTLDRNWVLNLFVLFKSYLTFNWVIFCVVFFRFVNRSRSFASYCSVHFVTFFTWSSKFIYQLQTNIR